MLFGLALHALDYHGMEGALVEDAARAARDDELDAVEAALALVAELVCGLEDDVGCLLAHTALVVECVGDGGGGKTRLAADISNTDFHGVLLNRLHRLFTSNLAQK